MATRNFSSTAAEATLSAGVNSSATTLSVSATTGFPATPFILAVDAGAAAQELVLVTNVAGTSLTVTRGYDSTVAVSHDAGAVVAHSHGAIDFREANTHVNSNSGVHGVTGSVVGTSDTQTLTSKTLALGSNTVSGTKAQFNAALTDGDFATLDGTETLTNKTLTAPAATGSLAGFGGAYTPYTPTLSGWTLGNGTLTGAYLQIGKHVTGWVSFTFGSTTTTSGELVISMPVASLITAGLVAGRAHIFDTSAVARFNRDVFIGATTMRFASEADVRVSGTVPMTWAVGDTLVAQFTYEAA